MSREITFSLALQFVRKMVQIRGRAPICEAWEARRYGAAVARLRRALFAKSCKKGIGGRQLDLCPFSFMSEERGRLMRRARRKRDVHFQQCKPLSCFKDYEENVKRVMVPVV